MVEMTAVGRLRELHWRELVEDDTASRRVGEALGACGAFMLRDCPAQRSTPPSVLYSAVAQLFQLPQDVLLGYQATDVKNEGGYIVPSIWKSLTLPEVWHVVSESRSADGRRRPPNVWPSELPHIRSMLVPYYEQLAQTADAVLAAVARFYRRPADYLVGLRPGGDDVLRLLYYRADPERSAPGFAPHADLSLVTLFPPATDPGLKIEVQPDVWEPVEVPEDGLMVGVGRSLNWLTDGEMPALQHTVRGLAEAGVDERYSASFFVNPRPDAEVSPLAEARRESMSATTGRGVTFEEWFQDRIRQTAASSHES